MDERLTAARALLLAQRHGVLATVAVDLPGYPFGSIVPYALDHQGRPLILISTLAQHTKNVQADPRCSLTIHDATLPDPQAAPRLTWVADARPVPADDTSAHARYQTYFRQSAGYLETHDFLLYRLELVRARFIGGFGRIFWIERDEAQVANPLAESEAGIVAHMNEDHADTMATYCQAFRGTHPAEVVMLGLDADGFDLLADGRHVRFPFPAPIARPDEARMALVAFAKEARARLAAGT